MNKDYWFISYSRQQLYFAESLAVTLQKKGVNTWFDIQRLDPGIDWAGGIAQALDNCVGLILVASKASVSSTYVMQEVMTVKAQGKPVHIVLFEALNLPDELKATSLIDFRGNFGRSIKRLASCIRTNTSATDKLPRPSRSSLPTRMSPGVWAVILSIGALSLTALLTGIFLAVEASIYWFLLFIAVAAYGVSLARQLLNRTISSYDWNRFFRWSFFSTVLALILGYFTQIRPEFVLILLIAIPAYLIYAYAQRTGDVLRWMPTGEGSQRVRNRINRFLKRRKASETRQPKRYTLHYELPDERIAKQVMKAMTRAGHVYLPFAATGFDYRIVLISNQSKQSTIRELLVDNRNLILIILSSVNLPIEATELSRYQWVDYRRRIRGRLRSMAEDLLSQGADVVTRARSLLIVPENLDKPVVPQSVSNGTLLLRLIAAASVAWSIWGVLSQLRVLGGTGSSTFLGRQLLDLVISFAYALLIFWLTSRIALRQISLRRFFTILLVTQAINLVYSFSLLTNGFTLITPPAIIRLGTFLILWIIYTLGFWRGFRNWLPVGGSQHRQLDALPTPAPRFRREYIVVSALYTGVIIYLFTGLSVFTPVTPERQFEFDYYLRGYRGFSPLMNTNIQTYQHVVIGDLQFDTPGEWVQVSIIDDDLTPLRQAIGGGAFLTLVSEADALKRQYSDIGALRWVGVYVPEPLGSHVAYLFDYAPVSRNDLASDFAAELSASIARSVRGSIIEDQGFEVNLLAFRLIRVQATLATANFVEVEYWFVGIEGESNHYWLFMYGDKSAMLNRRASLEAWLNSFCIASETECPSMA